jgi:hypothetical protein
MWRRLLIGVLSLLTVGGTVGCGGGQDSSTHISTVAPHINPKAHHRLLVANAKRHTRVAKANADQPISISFWDTQRGLVAGATSTRANALAPSP